MINFDCGHYFTLLLVASPNMYPIYMYGEAIVGLNWIPITVQVTIQFNSLSFPIYSDVSSTSLPCIIIIAQYDYHSQGEQLTTGRVHNRTREFRGGSNLNMYTTSTQHRAVKLQMPFMSSFSMNIISGSCKLSFTEITHFYYIYHDSSAFLFMFDIPVSLFARLLYLSTLKKCSQCISRERSILIPI